MRDLHLGLGIRTMLYCALMHLITQVASNLYICISIEEVLIFVSTNIASSFEHNTKYFPYYTKAT